MNCAAKALGAYQRCFSRFADHNMEKTEKLGCGTVPRKQRLKSQCFERSGKTPLLLERVEPSRKEGIVAVIF
jgi:hypothetical protein